MTPVLAPVRSPKTNRFVRRSSGLAREIGLADAFGINAGAQSVGGALAFFGLLLVLFPGVNIGAMLILGGVLIAPLAWVPPRRSARY